MGLLNRTPEDREIEAEQRVLRLRRTEAHQLSERVDWSDQHHRHTAGLDSHASAEKRPRKSSRGVGIACALTQQPSCRPATLQTASHGMVKSCGAYQCSRYRPPKPTLMSSPRPSYCGRPDLSPLAASSRVQSMLAALLPPQAGPEGSASWQALAAAALAAALHWQRPLLGTASVCHGTRKRPQLNC